MIKAGIIGATGYAGAELARLLLQREDVEIVWYGSRSYVGEDFASIYRNTAHAVNEPCKDDDMAKLAEIADVIFTATPQGFCASQVTEDILSKTKIIDLSADFRIKDVDVYEKWYKICLLYTSEVPGTFTIRAFSRSSYFVCDGSYLFYGSGIFGTDHSGDL